MSIAPKISINPVPEPNKPTDGYRFVRHDAAPDWEILDATWMIIRKFIKCIGEAADNVVSIEASFAQLPSPGELKLILVIVYNVQGTTPISLTHSYHYISAPHMRDSKTIDQYVIEPMRNELAQALATKAYELLDSSAQIEKLLGHTGPPNYGDLY